eukprot:Nitzschia sp. Nitz4//scaffold136_size62208//44488//48522//NITZ4_006376-RA/size62208-processed-gene-0.41-mRNA-1//-1//CDS//3329535642//4046//frame0
MPSSETATATPTNIKKVWEQRNSGGNWKPIHFDDEGNSASNSPLKQIKTEGILHRQPRQSRRSSMPMMQSSNSNTSEGNTSNNPVANGDEHLTLTPPSLSTSSTPTGGRRRKLSTKLKGRLSAYEQSCLLSESQHGPSKSKTQLAASHSSLNKSSSYSNIYRDSNGNGNDNGNDNDNDYSTGDSASPSSSGASTPLQTSKPTKRKSKASKIIQQLNQRIESPVTNSSHSRSVNSLLTPRDIKSLIKASSTPKKVNKYLSNSPLKASKALLTPKQVRALVTQSNKTSTMIHQFEIKNKKSRKANGTLTSDNDDGDGDDASKEPPTLQQVKAEAKQRRRHKKSLHRRKTDKDPSGLERIRAALEENDAIFNKVRPARSKALDLSKPPPNHPKTKEQTDLIQETTKSHFAFAKFQQGLSHKMKSILGAFEPIALEKGDAVDQDHFYIVEEGQVDVTVEGKTVGTLQAGQCFGEENLLHGTTTSNDNNNNKNSKNNNNNTLVATSSTKVLKISSDDYKVILQTHAAQQVMIKRSLLQKVVTLEPWLKRDPTLLGKFAGLLKPKELFMEDEWEINESETLVLLHEGTMQVVSTNKALQSGEYVGQDSLLAAPPPPTHTLLQATGNVVAYSLSRADVLRVCGADYLHQQETITAVENHMTQKDRAFFETRGEVTTRVSRNEFKDGDEIFSQEQENAPNLYIVQDGAAEVTYYEEGDLKSKVVQKGDVFGDENIELVHGTPALHRDGACSAHAMGTTTLGIMPLEAKASKSPVADKSLLDLQSKIRNAVQTNVGLQDLEKIKLLGEGQFGQVWLVSVDVFQTGVEGLRQNFALKSQYKTDDIRDDEALEAIQREIDVMKQLNHSGIVNLVNTYEDEECMYMLMGLVPGGELWDLVHKEDDNGNWKSGLSEDQARFYTLGIADALFYLHGKQFVYRDLKPENVMIDSDGYPVLVDFGFAKHCPDNMTFTFCGTPNYVAPEVITHEGHGSAVDFWSLGITLYELTTGENPFWYDGMDQVSLYDAICSVEYYPYKDDKSDDLKDLTNRLLYKDPATRMGSQVGGLVEFAKHPFFQSLDLVSIRQRTFPAPWKPQSEETLDEDAMEELMAGFSCVNEPTTALLAPALDDSMRFDDLAVPEVIEEASVEASKDEDFDMDDTSFYESGTSFAGASETPTATPTVSRPTTPQERKDIENAVKKGAIDPPALVEDHEGDPSPAQDKTPSPRGVSSLVKEVESPKGEVVQSEEEYEEVPSGDMSLSELPPPPEEEPVLLSPESRKQSFSSVFTPTGSRRGSSRRFDPTSANSPSYKSPLTLSGRRRATRRVEKAAKKERRSTIKGALEHLGLDDLHDLDF